jgi:stage II sporulation protein D
MGVDVLGWLVALLAAAPQPQSVAQAMPELPPAIRVVLSDSGTAQQVGGELAWFAGDSKLGTTSAATSVALTDKGVKAELGRKGAEAERLIAKPLRDGAYVSFKGHSFRGQFEFFRGKKGALIVLNVVPLEDYLLGVVPSEMPSNWPPEALRAQAVAARTFAISRMLDHIYDTYDVYDDQSAQVYLGVRGENERSTQAVRDTAGQVLTYNGTPITAYFFSDAGGYTKDGKLPYLRAKPSKYPKSPHNSWRIPLKAEDLARFAEKCGTPVGKLRSVSSENDPVSAYLIRIIIEGERGTCEIGANKLRELIGLERMKSTRAWLEPPAGAVQSAAGSSPAKSTPRVAIATADATSTGIVLEGWSKPSVACAKGVFALKLRNLFAWNGRSLARCDKRVFIWSNGAADGAASIVDDRAAPADASAASAAAGSITVPVGADGVVLAGSGYGHGLGLSQYGARQLAEEGKNYRDILLYFYTGVELVNWDGTLAKPAAQPEEDKHGFYRPFKWQTRD